jgi:hypothetical protein
VIDQHAGDQSENRNDAGGGLSSWRKKGLSVFGVCLFLGVRDSRQNEKKSKKGRARKKKEGTNGPDPLMIIAMFWLDSTHNKCSQVLYTLCVMA